MKKPYLLLIVLIVNAGCVPKGSNESSKLKASQLVWGTKNATITSVKVLNNQLVITGNNLSKVTAVEMKNNLTDESFKIDSATTNQLIANGIHNIAFGVGQVFDLILSDASGSAIYQVSFNLPNGSVTYANISSAGATAGQFLKFNGLNWVPSSLIEGQSYLGTWDPANNGQLGNQDLANPSSFSPGDYFICTGAGTFYGTTYALGDWIISDGFNWQKIPAAKASVSSFQGRKGIVILQDSDYVSLKNTTTQKLTGSSINDLADVNIVTPVNGSVLKYNSASSKWIIGTDNTGVTPASIADADISVTANIAQSKISGLAAAISDMQHASTLGTAVRATPLTGLAATSGSALAATDSVLNAFGKLMNIPTDYVSKSAGSAITTGTIAVSGTGMITIPTASGATPTEAANITYVTNSINSYGQWDKSGSNAYRSTGNVGIGTSTPVSKLSLGSNNTGYQNRIALYESTGVDFRGIGMANPSGTNYGVAIWANKTPSDTNMDFFVKDGGNVGIGTNSPSSSLSFDGTAGRAIAMERNSNASTAGQALTLASGGSTVGGTNLSGGDLNLKSGTSTGTGSSNLHFFTATSGNSGSSDNVLTEKMTIAGSGNIGIGTTVPTSILHTVATGIKTASYTGNLLTNTATSSIASTAKIGLDVQSTGNWTGASATNTGLNVNVSGGTNNYSAVFNGGNVGIGTTAPITKLEVVAATLGTNLNDSVEIERLNSSNGNNNYLDFRQIRTSAGNAWTNAGTRIQEKIDSTWMGYIQFNGNGNDGGISFGTGTTTTAPGNVTERMRINSSGKVGIGTNSPAYALDVVGTINASGDIGADGTVYANGVDLSSDRRWKRNIIPIKQSIEKIKKITGVSYDWAVDEYPQKHFTNKKQIGIIAQDVQAVFPELVHENSEGFLTVNYPALIAPLIEAFKAQQNQLEANLRMFKTMQGELEGVKRDIATLRAEKDQEIAQLRKENAEIKARLNRIEQLLLKSK